MGTLRLAESYNRLRDYVMDHDQFLMQHQEKISQYNTLFNFGIVMAGLVLLWMGLISYSVWRLRKDTDNK